MLKGELQQTQKLRSSEFGGENFFPFKPRPTQKKEMPKSPKGKSFSVIGFETKSKRPWK